MYSTTFDGGGNAKFSCMKYNDFTLMVSSLGSSMTKNQANELLEMAKNSLTSNEVYSLIKHSIWVIKFEYIEPLYTLTSY